MNPDGSEIHLEGDPASPFREMQGSEGYFVAPFELMLDTTPGVDGAHFRSARTLVRDPSYRFLCDAADEAVFADAMSELASALVPKRGPGTLVVKARSGTNAGAMRMIRCLYAGGLEGDSLLGRDQKVRWWPFTLRFKALDPCWYSMEPATASWQGKPALPWLAPGVVMQFSEVGVDLVSALDLEGDADTYPEFTLQGPFLSVRATNSRTGEWWEVSRDTEASEALLVITKPTEQSITILRKVGADWVSTGESAWGSKAPTSNLFPLSPADRNRGIPSDDVVWTVNGTSDETWLFVSAPIAWNTAP